TSPARPGPPEPARRVARPPRRSRGRGGSLRGLRQAARSGPRDGARRRDQSVAGGGARAPVRRASRTAERGARLCPPAHTAGGAATHAPRRVAPGNRCRSGRARAFPAERPARQAVAEIGDRADPLARRATPYESFGRLTRILVCRRTHGGPD